jgi:hypothetical protein
MGAGTQAEAVEARSEKKESRALLERTNGTIESAWRTNSESGLRARDLYKS